MKKRILIIDDSRISRTIIKKCIGNDAGYEFCEAENGLEGLEKYRSFSPDIMFLDMTMPVMDGRTFLKEIKKEDMNAKIIVCTADIQQKSLEEIFQLGVESIVKKPPTKETVQVAIANIDQGK